jgi:hypothetical protein
MTSREVHVRRIGIVSEKPFEEVIAALDAGLSRPNMGEYINRLMQAASFEEMQKITQSTQGKFGLMEFVRFDLGAMISKASGTQKRCIRLLAGNPLTMQSMAKHVIDAGSYAPVTILIDERADGVHLTYDEMASFLEPYGNTEALQVARDLDAKVKNLLMEAAG